MWTTSLISSLAILAVAGHPHRHDKRTNPDKALDFLKHYGYLEDNGSGGPAGALYSQDSVGNAISEFQKFYNLPVTGELDRATVKLMNSSRCGVPDIVRPTAGRSGRHRHRRYVLSPNAWNKRHLTYSFTRWTRSLPPQVVSQEFRRALDTWSKYSGLTFTEVADQTLADINVGFYGSAHGDRYPFDGRGMVLAHAFYPNTWGDLSGDVHFDDDEDWKIKPGIFDSGVDFTSVAIHELGHALGLSHSMDQNSIMYAYYKGGGEDLGYDDILALHKLYVSRNLDERAPVTTRQYQTSSWWTTPWRSTRPVRDTSGTPAPTTPKSPETPPPPTTPAPPKEQPRKNDGPRGAPATDEGQVEADGCTGHFDTVAHIRGQLFIVKNLTLWRLSGPGQVLPGYPVRFHRFFHKFPTTIKRIDAIYEREHDSSIVTFSGDKFWVFDGFDFIEDSPRPITDYGLPNYVKSVDAAMVWAKDSKTYIFSGDKYWRYNETSKKMDDGFPMPISDFKGIPEDLDTALTWTDGVSYFFKGDNYWALDNAMVSAQDGYPKPASAYWLDC